LIANIKLTTLKIQDFRRIKVQLLEATTYLAEIAKLAGFYLNSFKTLNSYILLQTDLALTQAKDGGMRKRKSILLKRRQQH
jgi:hypothetical protein